MLLYRFQLSWRQDLCCGTTFSDSEYSRSALAVISSTTNVYPNAIDPLSIATIKDPYAWVFLQNAFASFLLAVRASRRAFEGLSQH
jgi:hypothetical protein